MMKNQGSGYHQSRQHACYDYTSAHSVEAMDKIMKFLKKHAANGTTVAQIAEGIGMSKTSTHRYVNYMAEENVIHVAVPCKHAQGGTTAAVYKPGPQSVMKANVVRKAREFTDLPLEFFGVKNAR